MNKEEYMPFDDIPEDREESYPCECGGEITRNKDVGLWECSLCGRNFLDTEYD